VQYHVCSNWFLAFHCIFWIYKLLCYEMHLFLKDIHLLSTGLPPAHSDLCACLNWTEAAVFWQSLIPFDTDLFTLKLLCCYVAEQQSTSLFWLCNRSFSVVNIEIIYSRYYASWDISVTCYGLDGRCSIPANGKRFFFTPQRSDRLWRPLSLLSNRYQG
jgi:hypothetical protein